MHRSKNMDTIWAFGLSAVQGENLCLVLGKKYQIENWPVGFAPSLMDYEKVLPRLAIFTPTACKAILEFPESAVRHLELLPKVMLLDEGYTQEDLEFAIDSGMSEILRPPYDRAKVEDKIRRALEIEAVHYDVLRMSKEIVVEREILERKNDILNFLVGFLTSTSVSMNTSDIVEMVTEKFQLLFPVRSVQAAIWDPNDKSGATDVFISAAEDNEAFEIWAKSLRDAVELARPATPLHMSIHNIEPKGQDEQWRNARPSDGHIITLPVSLDEQQVGVLLVLTDMMRSLSRDQAMALNSALRHLALTLKNAQSFSTLKRHADYDGLTGLHNRRNFEQRIKDEVERAMRYGHPLSLIFTDLDHFKNINDSKGHRAGDAVLKELAGILGKARRGSDYIARYGGEEFVLVLPHTDAKQAHLLAERLRQQVEEHEFETDSGKVSLTLSQGVADLSSIGVKNAESLICEADRALYQAKRSGRNRTICCKIRKAKLAV